jgi:hypothetical protein
LAFFHHLVSQKARPSFPHRAPEIITFKKILFMPMLALPVALKHFYLFISSINNKGEKSKKRRTLTPLNHKLPFSRDMGRLISDTNSPSFIP